MDTSDSTTQEAQATSEPEAMLNAIQARVLGALMEKQQTTPDAYPLTLNSLVLACNQKTSREPVTNLTNGEVQRCLSQLQDRNLIEIEYGSRADRYGQRLTRVLAVDKAVQAVLNVMMLRGPQTISDLLTRTTRMHAFTSATELQELLDHQCTKTKPIMQKIPRQAGQREDRYVHLLCGPPDMTALAASAGASSRTESGAELEARVELLERQMAKLMELNGVSADDLESL